MNFSEMQTGRYFIITTIGTLAGLIFFIIIWMRMGGGFRLQKSPQFDLITKTITWNNVSLWKEKLKPLHKLTQFVAIFLMLVLAICPAAIPM